MNFTQVVDTTWADLHSWIISIFRQECVNIFREILRFADDMMLFQHFQGWVCQTQCLLSHSDTPYAGLVAFNGS